MIYSVALLVQLASPPNDCRPLDQFADETGGVVQVMTPRELERARLLYAAMPPISDYPIAERGLYVSPAPGVFVFAFERDGQVCNGSSILDAGMIAKVTEYLFGRNV